MNTRNPWVASGPDVEDLGTMVERPVVDDHDFESDA
jgi:hypothetical protein